MLENHTELKDGIDNEHMKAEISKEYYRRVQKVLHTELNSKNNITAMNMLAVPVMPTVLVLSTGSGQIFRK